MNLMGNFIYNLGPIVIFDFLIMESIVMRGNSAKDCQSKKNPQPIASSGLRVLAQREGFEPYYIVDKSMPTAQTVYLLCLVRPLEPAHLPIGDDSTNLF